MTFDRICSRLAEVGTPAHVLDRVHRELLFKDLDRTLPYVLATPSSVMFLDGVPRYVIPDGCYLAYLG